MQQQRKRLPVASMRPPDLPGGNHGVIALLLATRTSASMRPPDLPGGNPARKDSLSHPLLASMRPPDLPGGNPGGIS